MDPKNELRLSLRHQRQALSPEFRATASVNIIHQLSQLDFFQTSQQIALYLPNDNEVDMRVLLTSYAEKSYYLPQLTSNKVLRFCAYRSGDELQANHLGILEPTTSCILAPEQLELVCVPLVGFDLQGQRLGMGGGYYDRTFAFKKAQKSTYPFLLGIAYECQKVTQLPCVDWDIPLNGVITEQDYYPQPLQT